MSDQDACPADRFCDLVMKGGITSGVVYPKAISRLARHYRFKNIGGTSAGAVAATVSAAAEYQRRRTGSMDGFAILDRVPDELGARPAQGGPSRLLGLFQPQPGTKRLFSVLAVALNRGSTSSIVIHVALGVLVAYWVRALLALVLGLAAGYWSGSMLVGILAFAVACVVLVLCGVYRDTLLATQNGFGLCTGMTEPGNADEALTPWLYNKIQESAGLGDTDDPLTFGALWDAPGFPPAGYHLPVAGPVRSINLQMFTTNLSHGRPYVLPFVEGDKARNPGLYAATQERLFYRREELSRYLPAVVLRWLSLKSAPYKLDPARAMFDPSESDAEGLFELPPARDFPVVLAARLSLSVPFLFSAVPLWAIDYDPAQGVGNRKFKRCWFSDGGLSSNFPIHMFDALIPLWPTFGISLERKLKERPNMTYLPPTYYEGYGERWQRFDEAGSPKARMGGFLFALINTMQEWNDNTLSRMPGVRDRVVRLRLDPDEGGLNLDMPASAITRVAARGVQAADELIKCYAATPAVGLETTSWDQQRWVRLGVLLRMLEKRLPGVRVALGTTPQATDWKTLIHEAMACPNTAGFDHPITPDEALALEQMRDLLSDFATRFDPLARRFPFEAIPEPELRVRPAL